MASYICEIILDVYGFCQNTNDIILMMNKSFKKSTTYKFLILCSIFSIFNYILKFIAMVWLLIDLREESCYYFSIGLIFTDFLSMWSLFGISALRFIFVVKKNFFVKLDQLEDVLWKFMFPVFLAIVLTLMFTIFESVIEAIQQVCK